MKSNHLIKMSHNCGFFSDFLTSLAGIMYCYDSDINCYVDWRNKRYTSNQDINLFDKFFYQELNGDEDFSTVHQTLTPYGYFFHEMKNFTNEDIVNFLQKPSDVIKTLNILNNDIFKSLDTNDIFQNKKVLGIHRRGTDHSLHGKIMSNIEIMKEVNNEFKKNSYDKIFLITDDTTSSNFFKSELGENLIVTDSITTDSTLGLHKISLDGLTLAEQVIRDSYLLSKTNFKMITRSNVSYFSLLCNLNKDNFKFIDNHIDYHY